MCTLQKVTGLLAKSLLVRFLTILVFMMEHEQCVREEGEMLRNLHPRIALPLILEEVRQV